MTKCILCGWNQTSILEEINTQLLKKEYSKLSINLDSYIHSSLFYHHCPQCDFRFYALKEGTIPSGDNDFYNAMNKFSWYYFSEKYEYAYAKQWIKPQQSVVEIGCGKGAFARYIPHTHYVGLELSTDAKEMAKANGVEVHNIAIQDYAKKHPNSYDVACSFQVLEHVNHPHSFLQSQVEILKGGGAD